MTRIHSQTTIWQSKKKQKNPTKHVFLQPKKKKIHKYIFIKTSNCFSNLL